MMLEIARENTERMLQLVTDILDVSRLESGRMELKRNPVSLAELTAEKLRAQSPLSADKGVRLVSEVPPNLPKAWVDAELTGRVLQNLVDNAIKFTPDGGLVKVVVRLCNEEIAKHVDLEVTEPPQLCVSVVDSGPGISAHLQRRLFQKFVTGGQKGSGSGLGLAFCKLVVDAHGGRIWVESEPDQGTTFTFTLPVAQED
jgi:signal transduction histidine kinase